MTVNAVNDAPVTNDTAVEVDEDSPYNGSIPVSDVDGDTTTVTVDQNVTNGTLVLNPNGTYTYTPNADFNGTDSFTYTVTDGNGGTATGTVTITVADINDPPVANDDAVETDEDQEYVGTLPVSDTEDDTLTTNVVTGPSNGQLVVRPDGTYTYTPNADFNGTDSFTYTVTDSDGATSGEATITITVEAQNDAPIAGDDTFTIDEDHRIDADVPVSDVDDDPLTVELVDGPANGTLTLNPDGTFTYTPNANFNGTDSFTYTVNDGTVTSEIATITIEINEVNDPPIATNDSYSVGEDGQLTGNVLDNDTDVDRDPVTATLVSGPANGTLTLNPDGSFTYTPNANFTGTDSFTYRTSDGELDSNTALVTIAVTEVNDPPVANDDSFTTDEDRQLTGNVLDNDTDVDGNPLGAVVVSGPSNGTLTLNADGTFTYTPNANFSGTDTFTYAASDGSLSDTALVTISVTAVNDPPVATNDSFTGTEDNPVSGNVLTNDVDADNDTLTAAVVSGPSRGTLNFNPDGTFTYTPNANYSGTDSFTYSVSDGQGGTATGTVTITVSAVNDAPVANNDSFVTDEDSPLAGNVLDNDTDIEGNTLTAAVVSGPSRGTLNFNADGSFTYTPNANYSGTDSFTYSVSDGQGGIATGTVTLTVTAVNDPPVANHDSYTVAEDGELQGNVLDNDSDVDGDELKAVLVSGPSSGSLTLNEDGTFTYRPNANFSGTDTFFYRVNDGTVNSSTRSVTISVTAVNDPPVAGNDSVTTNEDTAYSGNVLSNDSDVDGNPLTATLRTQATNGSVTLNSNGTFTYTPHENWSGADSFTYTVSDGQGGTAIGTVSITVTPVNDRPVAGNDGFSVDEDGVLTGNVLTNDTDVDGTIQSASVVTGPTRGTLEFNSTTGAFTYRPNANYSGTDSFTYTVTDGSLTSEVATVTITVTAVNDAPVANNASHTINQATNGQPTVFNGTLSGSDVDSSSLTYTITNPPQNGTISNFNPSTGTFTFTPSGPGTASFTYTVSDGSATSNTATVSFTIVDNVAPTPVTVQATNGSGGTVSRLDQGDTIVYTFSEPIDPNTIMAGWNGSATTVTVRAYEGDLVLGLLAPDSLQVYNAANNQELNLGTVSLGRTDYVNSLLGVLLGNHLRFSNSTMVMTGNTITVTIGADYTPVGVISRGTAGGTGTLTWTPSSGVTDSAGNPLASGPVTESGPADRDF
nr:cadherin-like domain-containing protein [Mycolicibacterium flavescens]